jgi:hypothetical protein
MNRFSIHAHRPATGVFRQSRLEPRPATGKSPAVRRTFSITCLLLAWFCATGAVWNIVQAIGWAGMIRDYSQVMPMSEAIEVTFGGTAPCHLCHLAEEGQTRDTPAPAAPGSGMEKILLIAECVPAPVLVAPDYSWPAATDATGTMRAESVPVPPPRV